MREEKKRMIRKNAKNVENLHTNEKQRKNLQMFKTLSLISFQAIFKLIRHVHAKVYHGLAISVVLQQQNE